MKLLLVDDHRLIRRGLRRLLESESDIEVVGEASNGREAIDQFSTLSPDLVLMDSSMPGLGGMEATRILCSEFEKANVLALSQYTDRETVEGMLAAGALGFVSKSDDVSGLVNAIRAIEQGEYYLSPAVTGDIVRNAIKSRQRGAQTGSIDLLTNREREVVQLIAEGHTSKSVGDLLSISARTADAHRRNAMTKLGIRTTAGLTKWAVLVKLTPSEP